MNARNLTFTSVENYITVDYRISISKTFVFLLMRFLSGKNNR